jgi:hypothetical protein
MVKKATFTTPAGASVPIYTLMLIASRLVQTLFQVYHLNEKHSH